MKPQAVLKKLGKKYTALEISEFCLKIVVCYHQESMSVQCIPLIPHFYMAKLGFGGGIPGFLIFGPKHRLWVLIRTRQGGSNAYPQSMFIAKALKVHIKFFWWKFQFLQLKKSLHIAWASFPNVKRHLGDLSCTLGHRYWWSDGQCRRDWKSFTWL